MLNDQGKLPKLAWREEIPDKQRRKIEALALPQVPYRQRVSQAKRPEEVYETVHEHIWDEVNAHLGTFAHSFPELVEQLGIMRFGHRPRVADTFCGSGQIPFEAARLGCDVYASDLNPIACLLTWGALNIVGGSEENRAELEQQQQAFVAKVQAEIDQLGVETDGKGWRVRGLVYCIETKCPQSGWMVPLLPSRILSVDYSVVAELIPNYELKRYDIKIVPSVSHQMMESAKKGTVQSDGRGKEPYMVHRKRSPPTPATARVLTLGGGG